MVLSTPSTQSSTQPNSYASQPTTQHSQQTLKGMSALYFHCSLLLFVETLSLHLTSPRASLHVSCDSLTAVCAIHSGVTHQQHQQQQQQSLAQVQALKLDPAYSPSRDRDGIVPVGARIRVVGPPVCMLALLLLFSLLSQLQPRASRHADFLPTRVILYHFPSCPTASTFELSCVCVLALPSIYLDVPRRLCSTITMKREQWNVQVRWRARMLACGPCECAHRYCWLGWRQNLHVVTAAT
jgi:hypothetical protein